MTKYDTYLKDCFWMKHDIFKDERGVFSEIFKNSHLKGSFKTAQSNYSFSKKSALRGIHRTPYAKYVTCVKGEVYDVCVDLRENSPTYEKHFGLLLNEQNLYSLYIPPFCGHAFLAITDSILIYHQEHEYNADLDKTFCYKNYNIPWVDDLSYIISKKDRACCNV